MPEKVLLIEDTRFFATLLSRLIEDAHGFSVDVAEGFESARSLLEAASEDYFIAIVDLNLPDAPPGAAVDLVTEKDIPAVVFTGVDDRSMQEDLWARGIADYAHKQGNYSLEYVVWVVKRIYLNRDVEVLIVDNSRAVRRGIERLLRVQKYKVYSCASGDEAIRMLKENSGIQIGIVDCFLKGMDGLELTASLREIKSANELEIIGVAYGSGNALSAKFIKAGANDFLIKPFDPEEFFCRINRSADRIDAYLTQRDLNLEKNRILGTAAHDIRGPLASIKTAAGLALKSEQKPDRVKSLMSMIERNSTHLIELLETLLDVSAIESGHTNLNLEEKCLSLIVDERLELYRDVASAKNIEMSADIERDVSVVLDDIKIKQVVDNLLTNAIKFSPKNSLITIALQKTDRHAEFCISDQGPGINEKEAEGLFEAYSVLSSKATGGEKKTGLGLAIARNIINAHEGKIYYAGNPEGGAKFFFELPITSAML